MRHQKVLITGASGFIGRKLTERLSNCHAVATYDLEQAPGKGEIAHTQGNILDTGLLTHAMKDVDSVVHLAAVLGVAFCQQAEDLVYKVNEGGARSIATAVRANPSVRSVIAVSSSEVYGEGRGRLLREDEPTRPLTAYGRSKVGLEQQILGLGNSSRSVAIVRPFNVYGPGQRPDFVVGRFCHQVLSGLPLQIAGTGLQTRTFTYIDDFIDGLTSAISYARDSSKQEIFNIASQETVTIIELAEMIADLARFRSRTMPLIEFTSLRKLGRSEGQEIGNRRPSIDKASRILRFHAKTPLIQGLKSMIDRDQSNSQFDGEYSYE